MVDLGALARVNEGGAVELLDDGGAGEDVAGAEARAVVDRAADEVVLALEEHSAVSRGRGAGLTTWIGSSGAA
jgi:hypothetical protein